jgi:PAS domain S-box-containing protein
MHLTGILRDVTERNLAEEQLRKNEERYRLLVELMPESVAILQDNTIVFANSSFIQLCSFKYQEEAIGKNIFDFIHYDYIDISKNISENIFNKKLKCMSYESKIITCDNKLVDVEITGSYFTYSDKPSILFIIRDISERQKNKVLIEKIEQNNMLLSEAREYDKLKTEFFSNISHEFKTPLSVILGTIQLLNLLVSKNQDNISIKFNKYFSSIKQNCYRLIRLVNNIIDITKIDSNYYDIKLQNKNIVDIVENIVLSIADYIENKGLLIEFIKDENEIVLACDPDKIERIMLNLISNAIKFTPAGGKISVKIKRNEGYVQISVIDTGIGIPPDKLDFIFERFRQIDKSLT